MLSLADGAGEVYTAGRAIYGAAKAVGAIRQATLFARYMALAKTLDVSTDVGQAVFYSGTGNAAKAEEYALQNGAKTIEMTPGGGWLNAKKLFEDGSVLTKEQAGKVWSIMSKRFADGASGKTVGFVDGARSDGIFNTVESPALEKSFASGKVTMLITGGH